MRISDWSSDVCSSDLATDDIFLYAVTRGAAKAGGWNLRAGPAAPAFAPEKVKDVEGGVKATFLDKRLRTNLAVFHTWKSDVQAIVNAFGTAGVTQYLQNNGTARIWGVELEDRKSTRLNSSH